MSRFQLSGTQLGGETFIVDDMPGASIHDGCRLAFGPDGNLYITMGDAGNPQLAQDPTSLAGKILRVEPDGAIPAGNSSGTAVWTLGHRNPQGLGFHPQTGRLYSTEHGPASDDEVNLIEEGNNYGWPDAMGTDATPPYTPALIAYTPTLAIAGMAIYQGTVFPAWQGDLLFVSLKAGELHRLQLNPDGSVAGDEILIDNSYGRLRDVGVAIVGDGLGREHEAAGREAQDLEDHLPRQEIAHRRHVGGRDVPALHGGHPIGSRGDGAVAAERVRALAGEETTAHEHVGEPVVLGSAHRIREHDRARIEQDPEHALPVIDLQDTRLPLLADELEDLGDAEVLEVPVERGAHPPALRINRPATTTPA